MSPGRARSTSAVSSAAPLRAALSSSSAIAPGDQSVASTRPPASAAARLGSPSPPPSARAPGGGDPEPAAELEHARATQRAPGEPPRERDAAGPQLGPVGQVLLVL